MDRLTDREIEIMHAIWESENDKVPTGEILKHLNQTKKRYLQPVQVVLRRLCDKNVLECNKIGHLNYYVSLIDPEEYRKYETGTFIERLYKGKAENLMLALIEEADLGKEAIQEMRKKLIERADKMDA